MLKVYTVYDSKAEAYLQPFFQVNRAVAIRMFGEAASDGQSNFHRHGGDYTLFEIGDWDPRKGVFVMSDSKVSLGTALEFANALKGE